MRKLLLIATMVISFIALFPLSWRLADPLFTRPFQQSSFDPLLLVCPDRIEVLYWHDLSKRREQLSRLKCTFQVLPSRQRWVENAVRQLQSPAPTKSVWLVRIKQLGAENQRIELQLTGDGFAGMIYEVRHGIVTPVNTRLVGPGGAFIAFGINVLLLLPWALFWFFARRALPHIFKLRNTAA